MDKTKVIKDLENKTLTIERVFDAPKEKVWKAYAEKDWFEKWWGPEGWETTAKEFDFRPGGRVHYCMKCVDENQGEWFGQESWGLVIMSEVNAPTSFVGKDYFPDAEGNQNSDLPGQTMSVELVDEDGKTRMISRSITETAEALEKMIEMGMVEGFESQMNKLDQLLAEQ
jgi:uncharacterized protein YndB with AHSA1/START domain